MRSSSTSTSSSSTPSGSMADGGTTSVVSSQLQLPLSDSDALQLRAASVHRQQVLKKVVMAVQERLLLPSVGRACLENAVQVLRPAEYDMVLEERTNEALCAFPDCSETLAAASSLPSGSSSRYRIDRARKIVYSSRPTPNSITDANGDVVAQFCSPQCQLASTEFRLSLSDVVISLRTNLPFKSLASTGVFEHSIVAPDISTLVEVSDTDKASSSADREEGTIDAVPIDTDAEGSSADAAVSFEDMLFGLYDQQRNVPSTIVHTPVKEALSTSANTCTADANGAAPRDGKLASMTDTSEWEMLQADSDGDDGCCNAAEFAQQLSSFARCFQLIFGWCVQPRTNMFLSQLRCTSTLAVPRFLAPRSAPDTDVQLIARQEALVANLQRSLEPLLGLLCTKDCIMPIKSMLVRLLPLMVQTFHIASAVPSLRRHEWRFITLSIINVLVFACWKDSDDAELRAVVGRFSDPSNLGLLRLLEDCGYRFEHLQTVLEAVWPSDKSSLAS